MINYIKNHKLLLAILSLVVIGSFFFFYIQKNNNKTNTIPNYNQIVPGSTTKEQVIGKLGKPIEEKQISSGELLTFKSDKTERPDEYYFQNGVNNLVKEIIPYNDNRKIDEIRNVYGNADLVLYGDGSVAGFYLFVYLKRGIAYIGNTTSGNLLEIWYFTPINEHDFIQNWASSYSKTQPSPEAEIQ